MDDSSFVAKRLVVSGMQSLQLVFHMVTFIYMLSCLARALVDTQFRYFVYLSLRRQHNVIQ